jgi:AcrR family transcriptional regulator
VKLVSSQELGGGAQPVSVVKILEGALRSIETIGARRLSMSDISDASGVSRGTLYRYFSSKEEVLAAASEFVCVAFETGIRDVGRNIANPIERFRAVMHFFAKFTIDRSPQRVFEVEPAFHLDFFRSHFARHKAAVREALDPVFDYFDAVHGAHIDRDGAVEALVRMQLSTLIVPASHHWIEIWNGAADAIEAWMLKFAAGTAGTKERMN